MEEGCARCKCPPMDEAADETVMMPVDSGLVHRLGHRMIVLQMPSTAASSGSADGDAADAAGDTDIATRVERLGDGAGCECKAG